MARDDLHNAVAPRQSAGLLGQRREPLPSILDQWSQLGVASAPELDESTVVRRGQRSVALPLAYLRLA
jgi:hypothetical protein